MARRLGNPNWCKPEVFKPAIPPEFERLASELRLKPNQHLKSKRLREWAERNRYYKYVPEALLEAWGFQVAITF